MITRARTRSGPGRALSLRALRVDIEAAVVQPVAQTSLLALGASTLQAFGWTAGNTAARRSRPLADASAEGEARRGGRRTPGRNAERAASCFPMCPLVENW